MCTGKAFPERFQVSRKGSMHMKGLAVSVAKLNECLSAKLTSICERTFVFGSSVRAMP